MATYNDRYAWEKRPININSHNNNVKKELRKAVSKKLRQQQWSQHLIHDMDDEMFQNICSMLDSSDNKDVKLALEILFKSKLYPYQIDKLVQNNHYAYVIKNGPLYSDDWESYMDYFYFTH